MSTCNLSLHCQCDGMDFDYYMFLLLDAFREERDNGFSQTNEPHPWDYNGLRFHFVRWASSINHTRES